MIHSSSLKLGYDREITVRVPKCHKMNPSKVGGNILRIKEQTWLTW